MIICDECEEPTEGFTGMKFDCTRDRHLVVGRINETGIHLCPKHWLDRLQSLDLGECEVCKKCLSKARDGGE